MTLRITSVNISILNFQYIIIIKYHFSLHQVSDGALRCFASLADRFTRRGTDPEPLAQHGLTKELLERLSNAAGPNLDRSVGSASATPDSKNNSTSVSTIVSLLSTLCRGSPVITHVRKMIYLLFRMVFVRVGN